MTGVPLYQKREIRIPTHREGARVERKPWATAQTHREGGRLRTAPMAGERTLLERPVWALPAFHPSGGGG